MTDLLSNYQHVIENVNVIHGSKGIYDVMVDGDLIYSKHETGRHAEDGEVLGLFKDKIGHDVPTYPK